MDLLGAKFCLRPTPVTHSVLNRTVARRSIGRRNFHHQGGGLPAGSRTSLRIRSAYRLVARLTAPHMRYVTVPLVPAAKHGQKKRNYILDTPMTEDQQLGRDRPELVIAIERYLAWWRPFGFPDVSDLEAAKVLSALCAGSSVAKSDK